MKIAIGSQGPAKVAAATAVLRQVYGDPEIVAVSVPSGVGDAPVSSEEAIRGALGRARSALEYADADLGIGIEDGIEETPHGTFLGGWAAVVDRTGRVGLAGGTRIALPEDWPSRVRRCKALGPILRERPAPAEQQSWGAIGWLTRGLVIREEVHRQAVAAALAPFLPENTLK